MLGVHVLKFLSRLSSWVEVLGLSLEFEGLGGFEMEVGTKSFSRWSVPVKKVASHWARTHTYFEGRGLVRSCFIDVYT